MALDPELQIFAGFRLPDLANIQGVRQGARALAAAPGIWPPMSQQIGDRCPCGSGAGYAGCCQPLHRGGPATSAEALMRSRYAAFCLSLADYLLATWHPTTRPELLELAGSPRWTGLTVLSSGERGDQGQVHFRAVYADASGWGYLEEQAEFARESGRWYYLAGKTRQGRWNPGRNESCPCGSGRKFKTCCQA